MGYDKAVVTRLWWQGCVRDLAELHDDVHHVALLVALIVLHNVGVVQAVQHLHLILGLHTACLA